MANINKCSIGQHLQSVGRDIVAKSPGFSTLKLLPKKIRSSGGLELAPVTAAPPFGVIGVLPLNDGLRADVTTRGDGPIVDISTSPTTGVPGSAESLNDYNDILQS